MPRASKFRGGAGDPPHGKEGLAVDLKTVFEKLAARHDLTRNEARALLERVVSGELPETAIAALLGALAVKGESGRDNDTLQLTCAPNPSTTTPSTTTPTCPVNPAGGPNKLTLTVGENADLDTGVSGISHNQGVTVGSKTFVCLKDCDLETDSVCTGTGETNTKGKTRTINGDTFGAPLPLLSGGVRMRPRCNRTRRRLARGCRLKAGDRLRNGHRFGMIDGSI